MNYRHAYHAGNFADVVKHAVLALLVAHLTRKDAPFAVFDVHAGIGRYDLKAEEAGKTLEYEEGVARFLAEPPPAELDPYVDTIRAMNPDGALRFYPGSPRVIRRLLRPQDRLVLAELHPEDAQTLRREFRGDPQVAVHQRDAYEALKGLLPPPERRGLVLIDPPFEAKDEFQRVVAGLKQAWKRWPTGIYGVWYPIKDRPPITAFHEALGDIGAGNVLAAELLVFPDDYPARLNGCGMVVLNPPWQLDEMLRRGLPELHRRLQRRGGGVRVDWLARSE